MSLWDAILEGYGTSGYGEPVKDKAESFEASEWVPVKLEIGGTYYGNVPAQVSYNEINLDFSNKVQAPEKPIWEFTINPVKFAWDSLDVGKYVLPLAVLTVVNSDVLSASLMDKFKYKNAVREGSSKAELDYITTSGVKLEATPGKTTTVLGTYKADTKNILDELGNVKSTDFGPRDGGFNLLNTPDKLYKTPQQFWNEYNKPWLDNVIERNDIIKLATEPTDDVLYRINIETGVKELSGFGKEYNYLLDHGYKFDSSTMQMVPRN